MNLRVMADFVLFSALILLGPGFQKESSPRVSCGSAVAELREATFNLEVGRTHLKNGKARAGCLTVNAAEPQCEWDIELTRAERWGDERRFLLAVVNENHVLGSGAWDTVFLYVCSRGQYVPVFSERFNYGATVELDGHAALWITSGVWRSTDPTCCASQTRRTHYVWNDNGRRFVVADSQVTRAK